MRARKLYLGAVVADERYRRDLGDLTPLMRSMVIDGQRQPIVVLDNLQLLAGERRLEAARKLGWETINVITARTLREGVDAIKADWASAGVVEYCLDMRPSERVAQVETLRFLHAREREIPPKDMSRAHRWAYQVEPHLADLLGMSMTIYRLVRLANLTARGIRPYGGRPVTDLDRKLARQAIDDIDSGYGIDAVGSRLRAQLGYGRNSRHPSLPTDEFRVPETRTRHSSAGGVPRRESLQREVATIASLLQTTARRFEKVTQDDRWKAHRDHLPRAVRLTIEESIKRLNTINEQIPALTPKEES